MIDVSYFVCTFYATVAALGYLMYGDATEKEITLNIVQGAHVQGSLVWI